jgi:[protein-PII] uridylyltransferase
MNTSSTVSQPQPSRARRSRDHSALINPDQIDAEIAAIAHSHGGNAGELRKAAVERFRLALDEGRALARAWLEDDNLGLPCARALSFLQDEIIGCIHRFVQTYLYPADNPSASERIAIVAVGGYGRNALAPGSDIDLLFLTPYKKTAWCESLIEGILYLLWDLRLKVGHATRSVEECLAQARGDMTIRTSVLEARFIRGDEALFEELRARFDKEVVRGSAREFVAAKLAERDLRVAKAGSSRYLVEPNVKEGKGGLRDLNTLFWISKYVYRVRETSELVEAGLFTGKELRLFDRCEEFLWRVRCHMHFVTGRSEERLSFDLQRVIAERLGYVTHGGLSAVERFMKHYFLIAKDVGDLTAIVCAALEERQAKPRAVLDRFIRGLRRRARALPGGEFSVEVDRVTVAHPDVFERDPVNLIRLFWVADRNGLAIHPDATRIVTRSLKRIDAAVRNDPEANRIFLEILTSKNAPETVLRRMNECGVLGRFIPDFGRVVAMMQFNMYHHYTVDEHLLRAVGVLSALEAGRLATELPVSHEIYPSIRNRTALYVAVFLHDVGKGRQEDHSKVGVEVALRLCPRFGLSAVETETVAWLIENHLVMSNTAQSRDLSDPRTIQRFAAIVQTLERLRLLLVLTVCDIIAVGPGVWNGWKGQLLRTLYWETELLLTGGHSGANRNQRVVRIQGELRAALGWPDDEFEAYAQRHYPAYWLKVEASRQVQHARLLAELSREERSLATIVATDAFRGVTELTVVAPDHPRLLCIIAGACASAGANIVDAQIFTTSDGLALDTISIGRAFPRDEDETRRASRIASAIEQALKGEIRMGDLVAARRKSEGDAGRTFQVAPDVMIDNTLSHKYTVIEVSGLDRPGLLYELTSALSRLNLNIGSAHVATFGERAVDVFYVTDLTGEKITTGLRQGAIRRAMIECFERLSGPIRASRRPELAQP